MIVKNKLQHPFFIFSVILLLVNDFCLKGIFGNVITGKLSDFAGLFAFPFFFSCFCPKYTKQIHILTAIGFVWWKSSWSQWVVDGVNGLGIPIARVVDWSDNMALVSIILSFIIFSRCVDYKKLKASILYSIIGVTSFSFMATSIPLPAYIEYAPVNKEYRFDKTTNAFIQDFNKLQIKEIEKLKDMGLTYDYDDGTGVYYINQYRDTFAYIIDPYKHKIDDTIRVKNYLSEFQIYTNSDNTTSLKLKKIILRTQEYKLSEESKDSARVHNYRYAHFADTVNGRRIVNKRYWSGFREPFTISTDSVENDKNLKKAIKEFEKRVVKKLR